MHYEFNILMFGLIKSASHRCCNFNLQTDMQPLYLTHFFSNVFCL